MLIRRLKLFNKIDRIVNSQIRKFATEFANVDGSYKNYDVIKNLNHNDKITLLKYLPNFFTNPDLKNAITGNHRQTRKILLNGKAARQLNNLPNPNTNISDDVWNAIKKAGYFKDGEASSITKEQFQNSIDKQIRAKNSVHSKMIADYQHSMFSPGDQQKVINRGIQSLGKNAKDSTELVSYINNDIDYKKTKGIVIRSKRLIPGQEATLTEGPNKSLVEELTAAKNDGKEKFNEVVGQKLEQSRVDNLKRINTTLGLFGVDTKDKTSDEILESLSKKTGWSKEEFDKRFLRDYHWDGVTIDNYDKMPIGKPSIIIGNDCATSAAFHETGHAIDVAKNNYKKYNKGFRNMYENTHISDEDLLKFKNAVTKNDRESKQFDDVMQTLGNEGMASLIGSNKNLNYLVKSTPKKGLNSIKAIRKHNIKRKQKQSDKDLLDAFSTYVVTGL